MFSMFYSNIILSAFNEDFSRFLNNYFSNFDNIFLTCCMTIHLTPYWTDLIVYSHHETLVRIRFNIRSRWTYFFLHRHLTFKSSVAQKSRSYKNKAYLSLLSNPNLRDFFSSLAFFVFARIFLTVFTILAPEIENITYVHSKNNLPMVKNVITIPIHPKIPK